MTLTDKTGAPVEVDREPGEFTISLDGAKVGLTETVDIGDQRVFPHTQVDEAYGGRGLATVLIGEALARTRAEGKRIVPVCPTVVAYTEKHPEYADIVDKPTRDVIAQLKS